MASQAPLFNAVIAVGLNIIILLVIWEIIYYIIYGPGKKDKFIDGFLKVVLWTVLGLIMAISIIAISTVYK